MAGSPNSHVCYHPRRTSRREEAAARAAERAKRSPKEQLRLLGLRSGSSMREAKRLAKAGA